MSEQQSLIHEPECSRYERLGRPFMAEFLGTMLFVFVGCLSVLSKDSTSIALGHGLAIAVLVAQFGGISGGHFNPAVTLGALIAGAINIQKVVLYFFAQMTGGLTGAYLARGILWTNAYKAIRGGAQTLNAEATVGQGILCEAVLTTFLVMTVLMAAVDTNTKTPLAPLAIGFTVAVDILAGMSITGASMNPARSFGPAVAFSSETSDYWTYHYIYWVGPAIGSAVAGLLYRVFLASSEHRIPFLS